MHTFHFVLHIVCTESHMSYRYHSGYFCFKFKYAKIINFSEKFCSITCYHTVLGFLIMFHCHRWGPKSCSLQVWMIPSGVILQTVLQVFMCLLFCITVFYLFTRLSIENNINPFKLLILMIYFVGNCRDPSLNFNDCWLFKDSLFWLPVLTFVSNMSVGNTCLILYLALVLTGLPYSLKPILKR